MEARLKELDQLLCNPENASDMTLVTEYTDTKRALDSEVERWEQLAETLEQCQQELA
jgi:ATP-binding cassette subfamily F protein 3